MAQDTDHTDPLAEASRLLTEVANDAEYVGEEDEEWADGARTVREAYTRALRMDPESLEAAAGLAVLAGAELRFHIVNHVDGSWWEEDSGPLTEIPADDETGRRLVAEAIRAARHVLSLEPDNNLAVYLEALAHECGARTTRRWTAICAPCSSTPGTMWPRTAPRRSTTHTTRRATRGRTPIRTPVTSGCSATAYGPATPVTRKWRTGASATRPTCGTRSRRWWRTRRGTTPICPPYGTAASA
ncbi:hypothetical protein SAZ11_22365 [Streptomyces sp. FXJ1.4098]|nr:hypothetical protein [Streptomyces sp. FXJ1.4098]